MRRRLITKRKTSTLKAQMAPYPNIPRADNLFQPLAGDPGAAGPYGAESRNASLQLWAREHMRELFAAGVDPSLQTHGVLPALHFAPKAKRVIYLFMSGGPSHIDLFDYKPNLRGYHGQELPGSVRMGQRITGMTSGQKSFPCVAPMFEFAQHGQCGAWISDLLPFAHALAHSIDAVVRERRAQAARDDVRRAILAYCAMHGDGRAEITICGSMR